MGFLRKLLGKENALQPNTKVLEKNRESGSIDIPIEVKQEPSSLDENAWNIKGNTLFSQGKYDEAIQAYDRAIEANPQYVDPLIKKGDTLYKQGKHDDAVYYYNKAIELNPKLIGTFGNMVYSISDIQSKIIYMKAIVSALKGLGKYDEIITAYGNAIDYFENKGMREECYAFMHLVEEQIDEWSKSGRNNEALDCCNKVIGIFPEDQFLLILYKKGRILQALKRYDEAINCLYKFMWSGERDGYFCGLECDSFLNIGLCYNELGKYECAVSAYDDAIKVGHEYGSVNLKPAKEATILRSKGVALKALGRNSEADAAYNKAKLLEGSTSSLL